MNETDYFVDTPDDQAEIDEVNRLLVEMAYPPNEEDEGVQVLEG